MAKKMLIKKTSKIKYVAISALCFVVFPALPADEQPSQALEQLRILQQRLNEGMAPAKDQKGANSNQMNKLLNAQGNQKQTASKENIKPPARKPAKRENKESGTGDIDSSLVEDEINQKAFGMLKKKLFPLKTEQIINLHKNLNESEFALAATPGTPPRPTATSQIVSLSPGTTPPVIRLAQGFVSSIVFLDSTGAPWPIVSYDLGDPEAFSIQWDKSGNTLMIQSKKLYTYGNLAIRLEDLNTPVMLTLVPGQKAVDYRVDMRIQGYGPNARSLPTGTGLPSHANNVLLKVLEGVPPNGSNPLRVKGGPAQAWVRGDRMYVQTRLTILSPGWIATMTSADGTHAYEMMKAPVLLISWHGKVMQLKLEGL